MVQTHGNKITWLGHATFKVVTSSGQVILIDPWVQGNPACPEALKKIDHVDTLLITHGHFDHIGDAVEIAKKHQPQVVAIPETAGWLESKGVANTAAMNKGGTQKVGDIAVTMVHAVHSCGIKDGDQIIYGGEACGYVVRLPGDLVIYHAGDTNVFSDMKLISELYSPEIVMIPIGDHYTMGPREAALAARLLGAPHVVPMHFGTFPALTGTPEKLRELARGQLFGAGTHEAAGLEVHALKPGETLADVHTAQHA